MPGASPSKSSIPKDPWQELLHPDVPSRLAKRIINSKSPEDTEAIIDDFLLNGSFDALQHNLAFVLGKQQEITKFIASLQSNLPEDPFVEAIAGRAEAASRNASAALNRLKQAVEDYGSK